MCIIVFTVEKKDPFLWRCTSHRPTHLKYSARSRSLPHLPHHTARSPAHHHHQCAALSPASGRPAPARFSTAPSPSPPPRTPTGATVSTKSSGAKTPKPLQRPPRPPPHPQPPSSRPRQYSIPQTTWKRSMRAVCQSPDSPRPLASGTFQRASLLPIPARYNPY